MAKTETWSKTVEAHGVKVRLYQRSNTGPIYRSVVMQRVVSANGKVRTRADRKSLGHSDRKLAEKQAKQLAEAIAKMRLTGQAPGRLTLVQLREVYNLERGPLLTLYRRGEVAKAFHLFVRHLGADFDVTDLGPHQVETYTAARQSGTLRPEGATHVANGARAGTIAKELGVLHAALNWATTFRRNGQPLIGRNPIRGVPIPSEPNPSRPVATRERFDKLLEHAEAIDPRLRMMLVLAWYTGRRLGAISNLRASDLLLNPEAVRRAVAAAGADEHLAEHWPAAISWSAEHDKEGVAWIVPIPEPLRAALAEYVKARAVVGNALLFPSPRDASKPVAKRTAHYWYLEASARAGLPRQKRGGWHSLRRAWATARKGLPLQDVMAAGGWRDPAALQRAYQHADAETVRAVMEFGA